MYNELRFMGSALSEEVSFLAVIGVISSGKPYSQLQSSILLKKQPPRLTSPCIPTRMITAHVTLDQVVDGGFKALLEHCDE